MSRSRIQTSGGREDFLQRLKPIMFAAVMSDPFGRLRVNLKLRPPKEEKRPDGETPSSALRINKLAATHCKSPLRKAAATKTAENSVLKLRGRA